MNAPLDFPAFVRFHRMERKLSQGDLADLAAIPRTVVTALETRRCIPGLPVLVSIAEALDPDPPMALTLRMAGYSYSPKQAPAPAEALWRTLDQPARQALQRLADVSSQKRTKCLHLVASVVTAWLEAEGVHA